MLPQTYSRQPKPLQVKNRRLSKTEKFFYDADADPEKILQSFVFLGQVEKGFNGIIFEGLKLYSL